MTDPHCEFCEREPTRRHEPMGVTLRAIWGVRFSCTRHRHWVRRLAFLDLGNVRMVETPTDIIDHDGPVGAV